MDIKLTKGQRIQSEDTVGSLLALNTDNSMYKKEPCSCILNKSFVTNFKNTIQIFRDQTTSFTLKGIPILHLLKESKPAFQ